MNRKIVVSLMVIFFAFTMLLHAEKSLERIANELANQGDSLFTEGNYSKAGKNFENAVEKLNEAVEKDGIPLDSNKNSLWLTNAYKSYAKGSDFENAVRVLVERKKLDPSNYDLVKTQAIIYKKYLNNIPKAIKILKAYEDIKQTFKNQKRIGSYYLALEDYENSLIWYNKAYKLRKDSGIIKKIAVILYKYLGRNEEAIKAYEKYIQTNPPKSVLAQTYSDMGKLYEDINDYRKSLEFYEKSFLLKYSKVLNMKLMSSYYDNEMYDRVLEKVNQLLNYDPNNKDAVYYRAKTNYKLNKFDSAKKDLLLLINDSTYGKEAKGLIESIESE